MHEGICVTVFWLWFQQPCSLVGTILSVVRFDHKKHNYDATSTKKFWTREKLFPGWPDARTFISFAFRLYEMSRKAVQSEREMENCPYMYLADPMERKELKMLWRQRELYAEFNDKVFCALLFWCKRECLENMKSIFDILDYILKVFYPSFV